MMDADLKEALSSPAGHRSRIREKYIAKGIDSFVDYELLELLLTFAIPRRDVKPVARALLAKYKTIPAVVDAEIDSLAAVPGMGRNSATLIKLIRDMSTVYLRQRLSELDYMDAPEKFCDYARAALGGYAYEVIMAFFLNTKNMMIESEIVNNGASDRVMVFPETIARLAVKYNARSVVLCHNHPGGTSFPSREDNVVTVDVRMALRSLNIFLLDHIIVSKYDYFSYREHETNLPAGKRLLDCLPAE